MNTKQTFSSLQWAPKGQYIGGNWREGRGGFRDVYSPSSGELLVSIRDASTEDLDAAVQAASQAWREWSSAGPVVRGRTIREAARRLREHERELALIDSLDCGNPLKGMEFDVALGATLLEYFGNVASELKGETVPQVGNKLTYTTREPLGVVARLVPFNHPLMFAAAKIAAPLAAGNAVIVKPSEDTPLTALKLMEIIGDLFPPGLVSVLTGGAELGGAISNHPGISAVGLIGSVETGRAVARSTAGGLKRTFLELGGKNALVICPDADIEKAIAGAVKGMNLGWTAGQSCGSTSRVLVHESLYDQVVEGITTAFNAVELGDPTDPNTVMGALSTERQYKKTVGFIERAKAAGATQACGHGLRPVPEGGFFVPPTLFCDVTADFEIAKEEIFGPVLTVLKWSDVQEMLSIVNGLEVGLTASIWTQSIDTAMQLSRKIEAGYIWVNDSSDHYLGAPFGGVKNSGLGREECLEEMYSYTEAKTVTIVT